MSECKHPRAPPENETRPGEGRARSHAAILVERAIDDPGCFVVVTPDREYGWLHCAFNDALRCAREIAPGYGLTIVSSAGRIAP